MATTGALLPSTWKSCNLSVNEYITVCRSFGPICSSHSHTHVSLSLVRFFLPFLSLPFSGKFVSESKFCTNPSAFIPHILKPNRTALEALITKPEVERKLLHRLQKKAATYAQDFCQDGELVKLPNGSSGKIDVDGVVDLYESFIIPLTKEVEVSCLNSLFLVSQCQSMNNFVILF